jgi:hypothetical protein
MRRLRMSLIQKNQIRLLLNVQRFEVLTAVTKKRPFYLLRRKQTPFTANFSRSPTLKMETACSPKTSVNFYYTSWYYIPEDSTCVLFTAKLTSVQM